MAQRPQHPSGRPIRRRDAKEPGHWRVPDDGYVTPRLRRECRDLSLVGFHHQCHEVAEDDDQ